MPHLQIENSFYINGLLSKLPDHIFNKVIWIRPAGLHCEDEELNETIDRRETFIPHSLEVIWHMSSNKVKLHHFNCSTCLEQLTGNCLRHVFIPELAYMKIPVVEMTPEYREKCKQVRRERSNRKYQERLAEEARKRRELALKMALSEGFSREFFDSWWDGTWHTWYNFIYLKSDAWFKKANERKALDGEKCLACGITRDKCILTVHHLPGTYSGVVDPLLPYGQEKLENLRSLCWECHQKEKRC